MTRPTRLGIMSRMYPELTATFLTEGLKNIFYMDNKKQNYRSIDSLYFDWDVEVNLLWFFIRVI